MRNFKPLAIFCRCTAWFASDQAGNQNVGFLTTRLNSDSFTNATKRRLEQTGRVWIGSTLSAVAKSNVEELSDKTWMIQMNMLHYVFAGRAHYSGDFVMSLLK